MTGEYHIILHDERVKFHVSVNRRISIIKGNSGTGKTTFINYIREYLKHGRSTGLHCQTNATKLVVLEADSDFESLLSSHKGSNSIFVADEDVRYVLSKSFANLLFESGCYLIYVSRARLFGALEFSVNSILEFRSTVSNSFVTVQAYPLFNDSSVKCFPNLVLTEDSTSGHDIVEHILKVGVKSTFGKNNVSNKLEEHNFPSNKVYLIVDGAAFGSILMDVLTWVKSSDCVLGDFWIFAPESFEYMLLRTSMFKRLISDELTNTPDYAESTKYRTWENYYEELLRSLCQGYPNVHYNKEKWSSLSGVFKTDKMLSEISSQLSDIDDLLKRY